MKKARMFMSYLILISMLVYAVKKHTDTVRDFTNGVIHVLIDPIKTTNQIYESKVALGFPDGCKQIIDIFHEKLPNEKEFYLSENLNSDALTSQRMIEYNFPNLLNKNARCGFAASMDHISGDSLNIIEDKDGYKIVCHL